MIYPEEFRQAHNPMQQLKADILSDLAADQGHWSEIRDGVRIYTRESQNPMLNANGGDYDYYSDYIVHDGLVIRITDWSADFDPHQWNVYSETGYCSLSVATLRAMIARLDSN